MPTETFAVVDSGDESGGRHSLVSWADLVAGNGTDEDGGGSIIMIVSKKFVFGGRWQIDNAHMRFATGDTLPDACTITGANLLIVPASLATDTDDVLYAADFYDFGGAPTISADWEVSSSGNAIASIDPDSLTESTINSIPLTGFSGINTLAGQYTGIRIAPKDTTEPTGDNYMELVSSENVAFQEPRLEVTYTIADTTITFGMGGTGRW